MTYKNSVYIATSLDGCIADHNGGLAWLDSISIPEGDDMGYKSFMTNIDALVMGRSTFETVLGFGVEWPYSKFVYVLSSQMKEIPENLIGKVEIVQGELQEVLKKIHNKGHLRLYIDGGKTIQSFLMEDLIDEMTITTILILLGDGIPLFGKMVKSLDFEHEETKVYLDQLVSSTFRRRR